MVSLEVHVAARYLVVFGEYCDDYSSFAGSIGEAKRIEFWQTTKNLG